MKRESQSHRFRLCSSILCTTPFPIVDSQTQSRIDFFFPCVFSYILLLSLFILFLIYFFLGKLTEHSNHVTSIVIFSIDIIRLTNIISRDALTKEVSKSNCYSACRVIGAKIRIWPAKTTTRTHYALERKRKKKNEENRDSDCSNGNVDTKYRDERKRGGGQEREKKEKENGHFPEQYTVTYRR